MSDMQRGEHGLRADPSPLAEGMGRAGFPRQHQQWPGTERKMDPPPDHGEETYEGSGKLVGRRALITGGDSGIGRAIAIAFAPEGADVAIAYLDEHDDAQDTLRWIQRAGRRSLAIQGDLSNAAHCHEIVRQVVDEFGGIDLLVNNAGTSKEAPTIAELTPEQLEYTFRTNFFAQIYTAQAALEHMEEGGVILNTGSVAGLDGHAALIDYAATKAAIHNFTKSLAQQVAERGIRVNAVAPGPVWTPLITTMRDPELLQAFGKDTLWKRAAQPAELAPTYVFLASTDARFITGEIIAVTGLTVTTR